jgi:hypothetical protein
MQDDLESMYVHVNVHVLKRMRDQRDPALKARSSTAQGEGCAAAETLG